MPAASLTAERWPRDDVKHLDARLNRLRRWHTDGLLCIGDAAHAMSPVGGLGISLPVQDAVAAARRPVPVLLGENPSPPSALAAAYLDGVGVRPERAPEFAWQS